MILGQQSTRDESSSESKIALAQSLLRRWFAPLLYVMMRSIGHYVLSPCVAEQVAVVKQDSSEA